MEKGVPIENININNLSEALLEPLLAYCVFLSDEHFLHKLNFSGNGNTFSTNESSKSDFLPFYGLVHYSQGTLSTFRQNSP